MRRPSAYRLFLTRNSEYHVRGSVCCAVRDRRTGRFVQSHAAIGRALRGAFADTGGRVRSAPIPIIGEPLVFERERAGAIRTSPVLCVEEREALRRPRPSDYESSFAPRLQRRRRSVA